MIEAEKLTALLKGKNHAAIAKRAGTTRAYINQLASGARTNPTLELVGRVLEAIEKESGKLCAVCLSYYSEELAACPGCDSQEVM